MNLPIAAVALSLIVVIGGGYAATQVFDVESFNVLDQTADCEYQAVSVDGDVYGSESEFRDAVQANGGNWTRLQSRVEFRTQNGVLQYKLNEETCE